MRDLILPGAQAAPFDEAVFVDHNNMRPQIPADSVVFLGKPGYRHEGMYSFAFEGRHQGDIRLVERRIGSGDYWVNVNAAPAHAARILTADVFEALQPRLVLGAARPFTQEFGHFLWRWAQGDGP